MRLRGRRLRLTQATSSALETHASAEEWAMRAHADEVIPINKLVTNSLIPAEHTIMVGEEVFHITLGVKEVFTAKSYRAQIVRDVHIRRRAIIEIVADGGGKLGGRSFRVYNPRGRRAIDVEARGDDAHVAHRAEPELLVAPTVGVHHAKITQLEIARTVRVGDIDAPLKGKAAIDDRASTPIREGVINQKLMPVVRASPGVAQLQAAFIAG